MSYFFVSIECASFRPEPFSRLFSSVIHLSLFNLLVFNYKCVFVNLLPTLQVNFRVLFALFESERPPSSSLFQFPLDILQLLASSELRSSDFSFPLAKHSQTNGTNRESSKDDSKNRNSCIEVFIGSNKHTSYCSLHC